MSDLQVKGLHVRFNNQEVLRNTTLAVKAGSFGVLVGASGSGKTTLLRAIAGLQSHQQGHVTWLGKNVDPPELKLIAGHPGIKLITQDFELLPMLSAYEHIYQGAAMWSESEKAKTANRLSNVFGLKKVAHQPVQTLSGGQQQRVALAKNLAADASLYLFDEAFSQLDLATRAQIMRKVKVYLKKMNKTALFVVHDPLDAFYLADSLFVLQSGRIVQKGLPIEVFAKPKSLAVARLFGITNKLACADAQKYFPNNRFYKLQQNVLFRPHEIDLHNQKVPFVVLDEVATPRGKLLQLGIGEHKIWVED